MALSHWGTVMALLNGMIGGTILILPLLGITSGWLMIPLVALVYGLISFFSAYLIVLHLGDAPNINETILDHFKGDHFYSVIYNIFVGFSLFGFLLSYFPLIVKQLQGLFHPSPIIPPLVALIMFINPLIMRKFHFAQKLLSIGVVGVLMYLAFLIWAQFSAPSGQRSVPAVEGQWINLSAALVMGYAIHDFIVQVLIKNPERKDYTRIVWHTYLLGMTMYAFISYGCFAIINRQPRVQQPETIQEYFDYGSWQVIVIQIMYLINLLTMSPQFMIIFKIRYMQICRYQQPEHIEWKEVVFYAITVGICYLTHVLDVKVATIIQLNGSIIGFSYIFIIPIWVHLKCVYYDKNCGHIMTPQQLQQQSRDQSQFDSKQIQYPQLTSQQYNNVPKQQNIQNMNQRVHNYQTNHQHRKPQCKVKYRSEFHKMAELVLIIIVLIIGFCSMCYTLYLMFFAQEAQPQIVMENTAQPADDQFLPFAKPIDTPETFVDNL